MAFEQKELNGALFRNDKGDNPKRPDYKGSALIDGIHYWMDAWVKDGNSGKFLSVAFKVKEKAEPKAEPTTTETKGDDDLPF